MDTIVRVARDWAVFAGIMFVGALTGLFTWAATTPAPEPPCGGVTFTCLHSPRVVDSHHHRYGTRFGPAREAIHP